MLRTRWMRRRVPSSRQADCEGGHNERAVSTPLRSLALMLVSLLRPAHLLRAAALALTAAAAAPIAAAPPAIEGTVQRVIDGDSLWLVPAAGGAPIELRLQGIDAPEICQAHGAEAKAALQELVANRTVRVRVDGRDVHDRQLGTVFVGERNVNRLMVQEGHAWSMRYKWDRGPYVAEERMAKALGRGFNRDGDAVMPRDFRRTHGPCQDATPAAASAGAGSAAPAVGPALKPTAASPYRCDGRTRCSQMTSCAEATWFLKHCPGVQMDGNRDGVPCERQWCRP